MRLSQLCAGVSVAGQRGPDVEIAEVRDDSRRVVAGDLFVAVRGQTVDGHSFVAAAAKQGARALVVEADVDVPSSVTVVRVPSAAKALGLIAANRWGRPADALTMLGVTGTNGKTTSTFLAEALVRASGGEPGVLGTVTYRYKDVSRAAPFTTPTPLELHATLAEMRDAGVTHVAMECSSHALALDRLEGVTFRVAAFTNLTQDHLDFHGTMEEYAQAKALLFREHVRPDGASVILMDHEYAVEMAKAAVGRVVRVSTVEDRPGDVKLREWTQDVTGIRATFDTPGGEVRLASPLIGRFNLENLAVAVGTGVALGLDGKTIAHALDGVRGVPGRVERVAAADARGFGVFVDYAHTPDALERVMAAARPLARGRLLVVFGCGGDRDRTKRPKMGRAAARDADLAIVTSDNPRTEDPTSIVDMILEGVMQEASPRLDARELSTAKRGWVAIVDRRAAIGAAMAAARPGDVVVIAGKGHEDYQIIGRTKHHFDDREEAADALAKLANSPLKSQS
jgi:UDP-N-acetylmuramoyl-L-alanyl-D-glutamate--2,6-diaminopimelate ligase